MDSGQNKTALYVGIAIAIIVGITLLIPMETWSGKISSGRYVSEGTIVDITPKENTIVVRLYSMTASNDRIETNTFLKLKGNIPTDCYRGQLVRIGYSKNGLYEDPNQEVQIDYMKKTNVFLGAILKYIGINTLGSTTYLDIVDLSSDGSLLKYNMAA